MSNLFWQEDALLLSGARTECVEDRRFRGQRDVASNVTVRGSAEQTRHSQKPALKSHLTHEQTETCGTIFVRHRVLLVV